MMTKMIQSPFSLQPSLNLNNEQKKVTPHEAHQSFKGVLKEAIKDVNELQLESADKTEQLAVGQTDNLHDVMITGEKAQITLQATVEIRNKVIEAYQEM